MNTDLRGALAYLDNLVEQRRHLDETTDDARDVAIAALRHQVSTSDDPHALARQVVPALYWDYPQIPVREIFAAFPDVFRGVNEVHTIAGPGPAVQCPQCGNWIRNRKSRTDGINRWEVCVDCAAKRRARWEAERRERAVLQQARIREAMAAGLLVERVQPAYREFLDTETGISYSPEALERAGYPF